MRRCSHCGASAKYVYIYPVRISYWQWHLWLSGISDNSRIQRNYYCDHCWAQFVNESLEEIDDGWCLVVTLANARTSFRSRRRKHPKRSRIKELMGG